MTWSKGFSRKILVNLLKAFCRAVKSGVSTAKSIQAFISLTFSYKTVSLWLLKMSHKADLRRRPEIQVNDGASFLQNKFKLEVKS